MKKITWTAEKISLLGTRSDRVLAKEWGVSPYTVLRKRLSLGIACHASRCEWTEDRLSRLGTATDASLAEAWGLTARTIERKRKQLGISRYLFSWTAERISQLGNHPDKKLASEWGLDPATVYRKRKLLELPMKKKSKLTDEEIDLSVMHHSLPVGLRAAVQSQLDEQTRAIMDYALVEDAARLLGLPESTLRTWIKLGRLPWIAWHGSNRLVRLSDARAIAANPPRRGRPAKPKPA